jgi:prepilin-type N-terminal cleavage/methylation domain-containing protein
MQKRHAFTMIELIFVIVIMGIIGKFGVDFLAQAYNSYIYEKINHTLQTNSGMAVEQIAKRLEYRIKDSVIARTIPTSDPVPISDASGDTYTVLEWIGYDNEGFRGLTAPYWSGIIDLDNSNANTLTSPDTNTTAVDNLIQTLSNNTATIADAALYFIGSNADVTVDFGWAGANHDQAHIDAQQGAMHPIQAGALLNEFTSSTGTNFAGVDIYEYYQLAWTAYAIVIEDYDDVEHKGKLVLYWGYQPWAGEAIADADFSATLMENVSTFQFMAIGSIMKIQVCTNSDLLQDEDGEYSLCKEKTVF